ncbi:hypothetical protein KKG46_00225 [Patescibacteria group bacterium]|nr:hypothetical protein [Patescibacteria group bacterium]
MTNQLQYPLLLELGLNETEAHIYEALLTKGPMTGSKIAEFSGIGRGNVYNAMQTLKAQHLVTEKEGKIAVFEAAPPSSLEMMLTKQKNKIEQISASFGNILPLLSSDYRLSTGKPIVRVFEGIEGLKEIYNDTLLQTDTIYALVSPDEPAPQLFDWLTTTYVKKRVNKQIPVNVVVNGTASQTSDYIAKNERELRTAKFVKNLDYKFSGEIDVFGDKVAFIAYKENELIGTIIENASIASTLRSTIKLLLDVLPE